VANSAAIEASSAANEASSATIEASSAAIVAEIIAQAVATNMVGSGQISCLLKKNETSIFAQQRLFE